MSLNQLSYAKTQKEFVWGTKWIKLVKKKKKQQQQQKIITLSLGFESRFGRLY